MKFRLHALKQEIIIPSHFHVSINLYPAPTGNGLHGFDVDYLLHHCLHGCVAEHKVKFVPPGHILQIDLYLFEPVILCDKSLLHHMVRIHRLGNFPVPAAACRAHFLMDQTKRP